MSDLNKAVTIATDLLKEHGLYQIGWRVAITNANRTFGVCKYRTKQIGLSAKLIPHCTDDSTWDTITHEIAHAIVGHKAGHGWEWVRKHRELGGTGNRLGDDTNFNGGKESRVSLHQENAKYIGTCPNGHTTYRYKRPTRKTSCTKCCSYFNEDYLFTWKYNS